jgi:hypothetical protein
VPHPKGRRGGSGNPSTPTPLDLSLPRPRDDILRRPSRRSRGGAAAGRPTPLERDGRAGPDCHGTGRRYDHNSMRQHTGPTTTPHSRTRRRWRRAEKPRSVVVVVAAAAALRCHVPKRRSDDDGPGSRRPLPRRGNPSRTRWTQWTNDAGWCRHVPTRPGGTREA